MKRKTTTAFTIATAFGLSFGAFAVALQSEITVRLDLSNEMFVEGERIRAVVDVANASADVIDCRGPNSPDKMLIELFRAHDQHRYDKIGNKPFVAGFGLLSGEGQRLETFIGDHFLFDECTRYMARAVLVHGGVRFESSLKSFDVNPGLNCGKPAMQMFAEHEGLQRHFELVHIGRNRVEHIFLKARDSGTSTRRWRTTDLGPVIRVTEPKISIRATGEVMVLHRATMDQFLYSEFWSLPDELEFQSREVLSDPEVVGSERMRELYKEAGGLEPVKKAWWKFW